MRNYTQSIVLALVVSLSVGLGGQPALGDGGGTPPPDICADLAFLDRAILAAIDEGLILANQAEAAHSQGNFELAKSLLKASQIKLAEAETLADVAAACRGR